jgi:hypothetical protein
MSNNQLVYDKNEKMLKSERNCVNPDMSKKLNLHYKTNLRDDRCFIDVNTRQSMGPGQYTISNHYSCECLMPDTVRTATNLPAVFFKNGYDVAPCVIDGATELRLGKTRKYPRCPNQLFERPYKTVPFMGRGNAGALMPDMELNLQTGEDTSVKRQCNTLSGITIPHQFTPLIDHLSQNIQNPIHIIEEDGIAEGIRRGGNNTSLLIQDLDWMNRCGYNYMDKETNREFWNDKHNFL